MCRLVQADVLPDEVSIYLKFNPLLFSGRRFLEFSGCFAFPRAKIMISVQFIFDVVFRAYIFKKQRVRGRFRRCLRFRFLGHQHRCVDLFLQVYGFVRIVLGVGVCDSFCLCLGGARGA